LIIELSIAHGAEGVARECRIWYNSDKRICRFFFAA